MSDRIRNINFVLLCRKKRRGSGAPTWQVGRQGRGAARAPRGSAAGRPRPRASPPCWRTLLCGWPPALPKHKMAGHRRDDEHSCEKHPTNREGMMSSTSGGDRNLTLGSAKHSESACDGIIGSVRSTKWHHNSSAGSVTTQHCALGMRTRAGQTEIA